MRRPAGSRSGRRRRLLIMDTTSTSRPATSRRSRMGTSLAGGVPTVLPAQELSACQQGALDLDRRHGERRDVAPGVVVISGWLTPNEQQTLVEQFRQWALPPAGLRHPRVPQGHLMSVQSVCLGWHWQPYAYSRTADDTDGAPVKPLPRDLAALARRAVTDAGAAGPFDHDAQIVPLRAPDRQSARRDRRGDRSTEAVVTISLGDTCVFR